MYKRPEKEKIIFGGTNSKKEILDLYPEYEGRIIKKMSGNIKKASDTELIFLGEVIDPAWWQSSHIFVELKSCPHLVIVGQTRSGKSKGLLSFCYGITAAYPETVWFFADGKGSPDYDDFAAYRSTFPVAKPDTDGDPLIQLANVIEAVWGYYSERKADFAKAGAAGKTCSTIYEYREKVEFIPQVFLVIDEFAAFVLEMDYESNSTKAGTIANRIRRLAAEAASYGIHLIIASQRYQGDNVPTSLRSNLTTRLVYNVQMSDANFLECPQSTRLTTGESYAYAPGLYSEHTGLNTVKVKLPYIGGDYMPLFKKHLKPIDPSLKKEFNKRLDYNKGGLNDALTISGLCLKLHRFLDCQDYVIKEKTKDFESSLLQMEVFKGQEVSGKSEFVQFGRNMKATSGVAIGISVIKPEDCHEDTFQEIQEENPNYPVIIVFVTGKTAAGSRQKFEKIEKTMNEKKTRFFFYSLSKFQRDMKNVEQNHKDGNRIDIIAQYLTGLGLSDASQSVAGAAIGWESINAKTPYKMIMSKLLRDLSLPIVSEEGLQIRGMPAIRVKLPAGWILTVIFSTEKNKRDDLRAIVQSQHALGHCSLIMTDERFPPGEIKYIESAHAAIWRLSELDQIREDAFQALAQKKAFVPARSIIYRLLSDLCIFREGSPIDFATEASITMDAELSSDGKKFKKVVIGCPDTRSVLYTYDDIAIEDFEMAALQLPLHLNVIVLNGLAPINAKKVTLAPGKGRQIINNIYFGGYHVERGILMQSEEEDSLAKEMLLKKLKGL
ncbi:MAG: hypothetical protein EOP06_05125 [Proteobacteria bacterium]|nr:MAG: hypothetical protein EOP06_05125 [Pseudomonadota bacterium]